MTTWFGVSQTIWMIAGIVMLGIFLKLLGAMLGGWQCHHILRITRNALYEVRLETSLRLMGGAQTKLEGIEPS